jgi:hypothetical protein
MRVQCTKSESHTHTPAAEVSRLMRDAAFRGSPAGAAVSGLPHQWTKLHLDQLGARTLRIANFS